jgi:hypothetical protein
MTFSCRDVHWNAKYTMGGVTEARQFMPLSTDEPMS